MSEQTLHFDNAREASDLTALPPETLSEVDRVFGVSLTAQIDLPDRKNSGLLEAEAALQNINDLAFVELTDDDVIRHPLVQKIIRAYRHHRV